MPKAFQSDTKTSALLLRKVPHPSLPQASDSNLPVQPGAYADHLSGLLSRAEQEDRPNAYFTQILRIWLQRVCDGRRSAKERRYSCKKTRKLLPAVLSVPRHRKPSSRIGVSKNRHASERSWTSALEKRAERYEKALCLELHIAYEALSGMLAFERIAHDPEVSEVLCLGPVYFSSFRSDFARAR